MLCFSKSVLQVGARSRSSPSAPCSPMFCRKSSFRVFHRMRLNALAEFLLKSNRLDRSTGLLLGFQLNWAWRVALHMASILTICPRMTEFLVAAVKELQFWPTGITPAISSHRKNSFQGTFHFFWTKKQSVLEPEIILHLLLLLLPCSCTPFWFWFYLPQEDRILCSCS